MSRMLQSQRGSALVIALAAMLFLGLLLAGLMPMLNQELKAGQLDRDILETRYVAEAGVKHALSVFENGGTWNWLGQPQRFAGQANKSYTVTITPSISGSPAAGTTYTIVSVGTITNAGVPGGPSWTARGTYTPQSLWSTIYAGTGMTINSGNTLTGTMETGASKVTNNSSMKVTLNVKHTVPTIASYGVSLTASDYAGGQAIKTGTINGTYYSASGYNLGGTYNATGGGTVTIFANGSLNINGSTIITTDATTTLRIITNGSMNINSNVTVSGNVQIFAGGSMTLNSGDVMTGNILIWSNGSMNINGGGTYNKALIIAAGDVNLNGSKFTGQVISGGDMIINSGNAFVNDSTVCSGAGWANPLK